MGPRFAVARRTRSRQTVWLFAALLLACTEGSPEVEKGSLLQSGGTSGSSGTTAGAQGATAGAPMTSAGRGGSVAGGSSASPAKSDAGGSGSPRAGTGAGGSSESTAGGNGQSGAVSSSLGGRAGGGGSVGGTGTSVAGSGAGGSSASPGSTKTHDGPWRIMPLGDSITGTTCYPQLLSKKLEDAGKSNFEFVGSNLNNQSCNGAPNVQTEGHGGYLVTYLVDDDPKPMANKGSLRELNEWLSTPTPPDVLLLLYGTNDVWNNIAPQTITSAYSFVLSKVREKNPSVITFVGTLLPMHPNGCVDSTSSCENNRVKALNAVIPDWAALASSASSPVYVVDVNGSVNADEFKPNSSLTGDGVHPNLTASANMAQVWYDALVDRGIP